MLETNSNVPVVPEADGDRLGILPFTRCDLSIDRNGVTTRNGDENTFFLPLVFRMTRQIVLPSAVPSETRRNEDGEMPINESLKTAVFPSTFSSHEFTNSLLSQLAVPRRRQPSLLAQVSSRYP